MLAFVIRDTPYLKILQPIIEEVAKRQVPYIVYHYDTARGEKEYLRASKQNINKSSNIILTAAKKVAAFSSDTQLVQLLKSDKIKKLVSVEIWLWAKKYIKELKHNKIKLYNFLYLSDSLWENNKDCILSMDKVYYTTKYLKEKQLQFLGLQEDHSRDRTVGCSIFNGLDKAIPGPDVLVLLPNLKEEHVKSAFGSKDNFINIIKALAKNNNLIFKLRKKQWLPKEIIPLAKEIVYDDDKMYPSKLIQLFGRTHTTVMFYSSGIYECVVGNQCVVNISIPFNRWAWNKDMMNEYFCSGLYDFDGIVRTASQERVIAGDIDIKRNENNRINWLNEFVGHPDFCLDAIIQDILSDN